MLPAFPNFKKIELSDRKIIEQFTQQFPPYNDFEFVSLWTYNMGEKNAFSTIYGNLVIKIHDFITGDFFYSFLGTNRIKETIAALLEKSKEDYLGDQLKLIPEVNIKSSPEVENYFSIKEDRDSFDYILSVDEIVDLKGGKYHYRRKNISRFNRHFPDHSIETLDLSKEETRQNIKELFFLWEQQKEKKRNETEIELTAIERLFDLVDVHNIMGLGIYIQNKLIGFSIYHTVQDNYAIFSFAKGDTSYKAIYEYLNHEVAKHLKTLGTVYINYEQDLGIPELREAKMSWGPVYFLKKYTIERL
ncbi:hypothetical protein A3D77_01775 [Candidatus Gottesmanbacteria bacterium RIFCSPHIGHO2_02_FULL_39_11]|uniref:Phosphatidylglycerol lysyltransferase C-terminal domain-containing protein n=1 Tax=Candidatus Gottesmanbacteria bacterium RIFCSPHIGHO2_02_FULL_39_11 TaxID=1798382 RepID=A0A1F5ZTS2_9BACT|nr:MAG: hypothetical protein A3D77_01775 [Candidatus Gottesmanbacteria bacterium RIFCSPHIGHO2_02_FULL_39_11]